ncbi:unnamed protein product [Rodentolepis nana]|uniref:Secreted protein n=1 Tax=Rodentolepis nana TaxID=102285 RepID=A0A0R3T8A7_RODNA|nr:unnamed protein product [Rodentolepis nana]
MELILRLSLPFSRVNGRARRYAACIYVVMPCHQWRWSPSMQLQHFKFTVLLLSFNWAIAWPNNQIDVSSVAYSAPFLMMHL